MFSNLKIKSIFVTLSATILITNLAVRIQKLNFYSDLMFYLDCSVGFVVDYITPPKLRKCTQARNNIFTVFQIHYHSLLKQTDDISQLSTSTIVV